jgi:hypothetical protein
MTKDIKMAVKLQPGRFEQLAMVHFVILLLRDAMIIDIDVRKD